MFKNVITISEKQEKLYQTFKNNLLSGINYYKELLPKIKFDTSECLLVMKKELDAFENLVLKINYT